MKHFLGTISAFCITLITSAQYSIKGHIVNEQNNQAVEAATVSIEKDGTSISSTITDNRGDYEFKGLKNKGAYLLIVEHVSLQKRTVNVEVSSDITVANLTLANNAYFLEPLEVKSLRASEKAPFAKTNISKQEIAKNNLGQDLPFLLSQTPGVVINSDAGNGIGYTGIRIRGSDATRINVTINGIPYNDAESQGSYFVDLPDIASSVNSIQIQRGVGSSSNGAGAFGASLNLSTNEFNEKAYGEINNSYGSFNSWKNTVKAGSGLINGHFTVDARLSRISSNGFIDRAATDLKSAYFSAAYIGKKSTVRFNYFSGLERTYQAWNGVPESLIKTNRIYNSAGTERPGDPYNNETDNYQQDHFQLFFNHSFSDHVSFNTGIFLIKGKGYYEQYKGVVAEQAAGSTSSTKFSKYGLPNAIFGRDTIKNTDLVRQLWLDNDYYGQIFSLLYKKDRNQVTFGGGWNQYDGNHYGQIIWAAIGIPKDYRYYDLEAVKTDINMYAKWERSLSNKFNLYADLQYRKVHYNMEGFKDNPTIFVTRNFNFLNPKAGISYNFNGVNAFASYALANKEPNRDDFEAGVANQPKAETLHDFEAGFEKRATLLSYGVTGYYMLYKNQLILTGQINDVGSYTRVNVPNSYRLGIELQGKVVVAPWLNAGANLALSRNKITNSQEYLDDYDNGGQVLISHKNADISFSPSVVGGATINLLPIKNGEISLLSKYVSRQYLDNTSNVSRSLNAYFVQDVRASYTIKNRLFKELNLVAAVYNVLNRKYEPNGYTFSYIYGGKTATENYYFPMAGTNFMAGVNIKL
ncbi:TonB-dependent receptor [Segetibacter aerophilus]|uniref:TonB-dependent receptor n=1 Tax=Segetibacter aerophilus TaxID=670293 RepID=A0A512BD49_9BACT|nr:TonB-dependent receptor plug domain-containing protein [Segetibacter aerophilus]GEO09854.1 TonB-dependent receptor [Segetibacter aerophilus]